MTSSDAALHREFFVAGGTLRSGAPSYVSRPADAELLAATMAGEFCYVLTPRQMGKSSLMVRTARQLQLAGVKTVILDLTSIGTDVTVEQWYLGLISRINARLNRTFDLTGWWSERGHLGVVQRFTEYLREILLQIEERVVIFIDEIDTTLSLDFRDDFFAAIRYFYNMRSDEPGLERLSIALLGVATPADLIRDRTRTPFNIGRRIDLLEFSRDDARVLEQGLEEMYPGQGIALFDRIFYWTNGHPYLTQKLCQAASEDAACAESPEQIDHKVHEFFLSEAARRETNLQFIRDNILGQPVEEQRKIVTLYRDVWRGRNVPEDERSSAQNRLKLIGLVKGSGGLLHVRNNIYRTVFDETWIKQAMPVDKNRRVAIVAVVALIVVIISAGALFWASRRQTSERVITEQTRLFESGNPAVRLTSLAALYDMNSQETVARADELLATLSQEEKIALFDPGTVTGLEGPLYSVAVALIARQENNPEGTALLSAIAAALDQSTDAKSVLIGSGVEEWLSGRAHELTGDFENAVADYSDAERLLDRNPCPALYFDLGTVYARSGDTTNALANLDRAVSESSYQSTVTQVTLPLWRERITDLAVERPELLGQWAIRRSDFPALTAILPVPTPTPMPSETPVFTIMPSVTPTSLPTETVISRPTETATPGITPLAQEVTRLIALINANLRAGPGLEFETVGIVTAGDIFEVIGRTSSAEWYNVLVQGEPVWISRDFVGLSADGVIVQDVPNDNIPVAGTIPARPTITRLAPTVTQLPTPTLVISPAPGGSSGSGSGPAPVQPPTEIPTTPAPIFTDTPPPPTTPAPIITDTPPPRMTPTP